MAYVRLDELASLIFGLVIASVPGGRSAKSGQSSSRGALPYVLYVDGYEPHKNLLRLIAGFAKALRNQQLSSTQLVLAGCTNIGRAQNYVADLRTEIDQHGFAGRTRWMGFIGDEELAAFMRGAEALILPSVREGV